MAHPAFDILSAFAAYPVASCIPLKDLGDSGVTVVARIDYAGQTRRDSLAVRRRWVRALTHPRFPRQM
jgi:hypothetical protein